MTEHFWIGVPVRRHLKCISDFSLKIYTTDNVRFKRFLATDLRPSLTQVWRNHGNEVIFDSIYHYVVIY